MAASDLARCLAGATLRLGVAILWARVAVGVVMSSTCRWADAVVLVNDLATLPLAALMTRPLAGMIAFSVVANTESHSETSQQ